jgi:hypothetical protein
VKRQNFDSSSYTRFLRDASNTKLYTSDISNRIPQTDRHSIVSIPPAASILRKGILYEFSQNVLDTVENVPEKVLEWYINTFIGTGGTISSPISNDTQCVVFYNNTLYYNSLYNVVSAVNLSTNVVSTFAGNGTDGAPSNGSAPSTSPLYSIESMHVSINGHMFICTSFPRAIYMIPSTDGTFFTVSMTAGSIYRIAGNTLTGTITNDTVALSTPMYNILAITTDSEGHLYISNTPITNTPPQIIAMMPNSDGTFFGQSMTVGRIYIIAGTPSGFDYNGDDIAPTSANINHSEGLICDQYDNLIISDSFNLRIRMIPRTAGTYFNVNMPTSGNIYTIAGNGTLGNAGDGGPAVSAQLRVPSGLQLDSIGNLYLCDRYNHRIRKITPSGIITTLAGNSPSGFELGGFSGDGGLAVDSKLNRPRNLTIRNDNTIYVADDINNRVRILNVQ